jgi:hypothetical protein
LKAPVSAPNYRNKKPHPINNGEAAKNIGKRLLANFFYLDGLHDIGINGKCFAALLFSVAQYKADGVACRPWDPYAASAAHLGMELPIDIIPCFVADGKYRFRNYFFGFHGKEEKFTINTQVYYFKAGLFNGLCGWATTGGPYR